MPHKKNVVLYFDADLVEKTRELGFNLSKTCEHHFKQLINGYQHFYPQNTCGDCGGGSPG